MDIRVNGKTHTINADPDAPLLLVLREHLGLTGSKFGCGQAICGACAVLVDGEKTLACATPVSAVAGKSIVTIEAITTVPAGKVVQEAWIKEDVPQCGYCQSAQVVAATDLLTRHPKPSQDQVNQAMDDHICRCGTYPRIRKAIDLAARTLATGSTGRKG